MAQFRGPTSIYDTYKVLLYLFRKNSYGPLTKEGKYLMESRIMGRFARGWSSVEDEFSYHQFSS